MALSLSQFKNHAHVMQTGNETALVNLAATGIAVAKTDNIGAMLAQTSSEG